jgi:hypothetical protein
VAGNRAERPALPAPDEADVACRDVERGLSLPFALRRVPATESPVDEHKLPLPEEAMDDLGFLTEDRDLESSREGFHAGAPVPARCRRDRRVANVRAQWRKSELRVAAEMAADRDLVECLDMDLSVSFLVIKS